MDAKFSWRFSGNGLERGGLRGMGTDTRHHFGEIALKVLEVIFTDEA
jgi:hypothetical protein